MANIDNVLIRLKGLKKGSNGRWLAKCPAHKDRSPSLSLRQAEDGKILIHCFGGCGTNEVLAAIGLDASDLFPKSIDKHHCAGGAHFDAYTALKALEDDNLVVLAACRMTIQGEKLSESDMARLVQAIERLTDARQLVMR